jgi:hypothetical protein
MQKTQYGEIPVSMHHTPPTFTRGDCLKAVKDARHAMHQRYGAVLDATYRLVATATPEQMKAARVVEDLDMALIDFGALCFLAGIHEADGESYEPGNARAAAMLMQIKERMTRTAAPEQDTPATVEG